MNTVRRRWGARRAAGKVRRGLVHVLCGLGPSLLLLALAPPASTALPPGVHGDPGSPAGKEYAFPLGQARGIGGGSGGFGSGIKRGGTQSVAAGSRRRSAAAGGSFSRRQSAPASVAAHPEPGSIQRGGTRALASRRIVPSGGNTLGTPALWMLGVALGVVALGWFGGEALVRLFRSDRPTAGARRR